MDWTADLDAELRARCAANESARAIALAMGLQRKCISARIAATGVSRAEPSGRAWSDDETATLIALWEGGSTSGEIGKQLGRTRQVIAEKIGRLRRNQKLALRGRIEKPPKERLAKSAGKRIFWTPGRLARMHLLAERGLSPDAIAEDLGAGLSGVKARLSPPTPRPPKKLVQTAPRPKAGSTMAAAPLRTLERAIIQPGFEKHLEPLLYFKGGVSLGRVHRMWNFTQAMKLQGCETVADGTQRLALNPQFSHLCGPDRAVQARSLASFWSRVLDTPQVWGEDPELIEFIKEMSFFRFHFDRLPKITHNPNSRWVGEWRTFVPGPWTKKAATGANVKEREPKFIDYPFLIHDGGGEEHRLLKLVNNAVPKTLPPDMRADVCQDLIVGILCGDFTEDDLRLPLKETLARVRKLYPSKWGPISLDSIVPGTDDLRLIDTISEDRGMWVHG